MADYTILLVDDDLLFARSLCKAMKQAAFDVAHVNAPQAAFDWLRTERPDAIVLDVDLQAALNGFDVARLLRQGGWTGSYVLSAGELAHIPILMLTGRSDTEDQISGYEAGVNDYMGKNHLYLSKRDLDVRLLLARLKMLLGGASERRATGMLRVGALTLHAETQRVLAAGTKLDLTVTEYELVHWLMRHPGVPQSRDVLLENVWGYENGDAATTRTVDACIGRLRKKLAGANLDGMLASKHSVGYFIVNESSVET